MFTQRLARLRTEMERTGLEALVVSGAANRRYLSGFTGDNGLLLIDHDRQILCTDFRYMEQAREEAPAFDLVRLGRDLWPEFGRMLMTRGYKRCGLEAAHLSLAEFEALKQIVPVERLTVQVGLVEALRMVKEAEELDWMARAAAISDRAWAKLLPSIKPGAIERDLAAELEYLMRREGADGTSFATIVASGYRGALPHGTASGKTLKQGELVIFDFGARTGDYCSDMTRTVSLGPPDAKSAEVYRVVLEAQEAALAAIRPGLRGREADAVARALIERHGYGEFFGHGLGHAVGLEIHEEPRLSPTGETILAAGMAVTVEPGIYLPGFGGVRIEDLVVVTEDGYRNLTASPKELLVI